ncbi:MAG: three-Cys-motif partner protein TcmP [Hyphomicrobiales bacterium]|nr:three-Cys-motif partner protein TcmP [Hyphomicrobiales bacterium]
MVDEAIWTIEQHTQAKHELLRRYLGAWFPILTASGFNRRVVFLDGFAGPGIYANGEPGSPLIAIETLVDHAHFEQLSRTEFVFIFVEADGERFASLEHELNGYWARRDGGKPANVRIELFNDEFAAVAAQLVAATHGQSKQLAPTLAFIDPFGWSGVPLDLIRDLLASDKCEVLFNFMYDSVNRFVADKRPGVARHFAELFGTSENEHKAASVLNGEDRKAFLRDLYMRQLQDVGGFTFVRSFDMMDLDRGRTAYFLMFGTRHHKGLQVMKDAMWSLDPIAGAQFSGHAGDQQMLFSEELDVSPLRRAILDRFTGESAAVEMIERFVIEETDYKATHYKKQVLKVLEEEGLLLCESERKRRGTYPKGTSLRFVEPGDQRDS